MRTGSSRGIPTAVVEMLNLGCEVKRSVWVILESHDGIFLKYSTAISGKNFPRHSKVTANSSSILCMYYFEKYCCILDYKRTQRLSSAGAYRP